MTSQTIAHRNSDPMNDLNSKTERNSSVQSQSEAANKTRQNINAKLFNPLAGYSHGQLEEMGEAYVLKYQVGDESDVEIFKKAAVLAQDPKKIESVVGLSEPDRDILRREFASRWSQPFLLYLVIVLCSTCAAVQGMGTFLNISERVLLTFPR